MDPHAAWLTLRLSESIPISEEICLPTPALKDASEAASGIIVLQSPSRENATDTPGSLVGSAAVLLRMTASETTAAATAAMSSTIASAR
jgi:hypothetical protein